ncbi:hypothetical protein JB92DRAFT_3140687 [Gautieria morchelliformis]|nr:hypothetical protein JB92DRAFT_3140687 [Gautieria morchelliformis]
MSRSHVRGVNQVPPCVTHDNPWMVNRQGWNPCKQVEQLCTSGPPVALGAVSSSLSCPMGGSPQNCCCSVALYALLSACWVCQGNKPADNVQTSYIDFFQNSGCPNPDSISSLPVAQLQFQSVDVPQWALIRPNDLSSHWNFSDAQANAKAGRLPDGPQADVSIISSQVMFPRSLTVLPTSSPSPDAAKRSLPSGTVAAAVLCSLALVAIICVGAWSVLRCRRRRAVTRLNRGARVDLTEPEMTEPSLGADVTSATVDPLKRAATFPFPFQNVVPRYHPNAQHSQEPSRSRSDSDRDARASRRHTAPAPAARSPMDQLDWDLARLQGVEVPAPAVTHRGDGKGQVHHPYIHKTQKRRATSITTFTPSSNSGSASSRRARRKSSGSEVPRGRYFHLPPSAQYLANVARYPEKVDPERPWDIRQDGVGEVKREDRV